MQVRSKLLRKYAELGFGATSPLHFTERSTAPCAEYSLAMVNKGPEFEIVLDVDNNNQKFTCIGTVVSGQDMLRQLQSIERATIVDARIVKSVIADEL